MIVGVLKESKEGETRVAATPDTVRKMVGLGYAVIVDPDAGLAASFDDQSYRDAGAQIGDGSSADVVLGVNTPAPTQLSGLKPGAVLIATLSPSMDPVLIDDLARRQVTALAMDAVPRISRAQSLDVLSSMANIAGYRAVIEAAHEFGRFFTGR